MKNSFMNLREMPERELEPDYEYGEENVVVCQCSFCGEDICDGEDMYEFRDGVTVCNREECEKELFEVLAEKVKTTARKVAE